VAMTNVGILYFSKKRCTKTSQAIMKINYGLAAEDSLMIEDAQAQARVRTQAHTHSHTVLSLLKVLNLFYVSHFSVV